MKQKQTDAANRAVAGAAAALVTAAEVRRLILAAQAAWRQQTKLGLTDDSFEAWRHGALWDACRKTSFRTVGQREFGLSLAYFGRMSDGGTAGRAGPANAAIAARESSEDGDRRRAAWKLEHTCLDLAQAFGGPESANAYAANLLRTIHKTDLDGATAKQIWQVIFTLRNRARALARKRELELEGGVPQ